VVEATGIGSGTKEAIFFFVRYPGLNREFGHSSPSPGSDGVLKKGTFNFSFLN
jgi:hypothetical protein